MGRRYQVYTYCSDSGTDAKLEFSTRRAALAAIRTEYTGYDGYAIYDRLYTRYIEFRGYFPDQWR